MSLSSEDREKVIDQLDEAIKDMTRAINTMKDAIMDDLPPDDEGAFLRSVTLISNMAKAIAVPMDKVAIMRMEDQF